MPAERSVTVIIPCYNEESNLRAGALSTVLAYARASALVRDVLVVDDGSADASRELVAEATATEPRLRLLDLYRSAGRVRRLDRAAFGRGRHP